MATYERDDPIWYDEKPYFFRESGRLDPKRGALASIGIVIDCDAEDAIEVPMAELIPRQLGYEHAGYWLESYLPQVPRTPRIWWRILIRERGQIIAPLFQSEEEARRDADRRAKKEAEDLLR